VGTRRKWGLGWSGKKQISEVALEYLGVEGLDLVLRRKEGWSRLHRSVAPWAVNGGGESREKNEGDVKLSLGIGVMTKGWGNNRRGELDGISKGGQVRWDKKGCGKG